MGHPTVEQGTKQMEHDPALSPGGKKTAATTTHIWKWRNLQQNKAQSTCAESTNKGVNQHSKYLTQAQQQRPELPTVTLTWRVCKYKVRKLHQRYILNCTVDDKSEPALVQPIFL